MLVLGLAISLSAAAPTPGQTQEFRYRSAEKSKAQYRLDAGAYRQRRSKHFGEAKKEQPIKTPTGPLEIVVSINSQRLSVYSNGLQIAEAPVSTGTPGHPTPMGIFSVIQKQKMHYSNLYDSAPMPYMQRITWSGVAMHAGMLPGHPASHGCIRMPADFAVRLYGLTKMGARVIVTRDDVAPVEVAHPQLFQPKMTDELLAINQAPSEPGSGRVVRMAQASLITIDTTGSVGGFTSGAALRIGELPDPDVAKIKGFPRRSGPVSVFISRKERKLFVRQEFMPLFDVPVTIHNPELPLGTHVFTAMELTKNGTDMRWTVVSMPSEYPRNGDQEETSRKKVSRDYREKSGKASIAMQIPKATLALDRIEMPQDAVDQISKLLTPGSSLIISDNGISDETGSDTDFVVLTR
jgi:lipoprotein-anchoring transpeptidase ErfK/SrfK